MPDTTEMNRRNFLAVAAAAACTCALSCPFARAEDGDDDDEPTKGPPPVPEGKTDVGAIADYAKDGVTDKWAVSRHFLVVREGGKLYALSAVCSHKANIVKLDAKNVIHCPKHNSLFDNTGVPTKGPATKSGPLMRFAVAADAKGHLIVDNSEKFDQDEWNKAGAFVAVK